MLINLREITTKGLLLQISNELDVSSVFSGNKTIISHGPAFVDLNASYVDDKVEVNGEIKIDLEQCCSRCLSPVKQTLHIPFHEAFIQKSDSSSEDGPEDLLIHSVVEDKLDLQPYIHENVVVELPFAPLCEANCKGLCPQCGTNHNESDCGCEQEKIDPRLAGLADFFKN